MPKQRTSSRPYARRGPVREPYDTVLIVCEGEKTEPNYFAGLRRHHDLSSLNVAILAARRSDPLAIVHFAEQKANLESYNRIYCVFDLDRLANVDRALKKIATLDAGGSGRWYAVTSMPCFEIWVLLHFKYTSSPYSSAGGRSACDNVVAHVRQHLPNYAKGDQTVYDQIKDRTGNAVTNAERLAVHNSGAGSHNPATRVHELVDYLCKLRPD